MLEEFGLIFLFLTCLGATIYFTSIVAKDAWSFLTSTQKPSSPTDPTPEPNLTKKPGKRSIASLIALARERLIKERQMAATAKESPPSPDSTKTKGSSKKTTQLPTVISEVARYHHSQSKRHGGQTSAMWHRAPKKERALAAEPSGHEKFMSREDEKAQDFFSSLPRDSTAQITPAAALPVIALQPALSPHEKLPSAEVKPDSLAAGLPALLPQDELLAEETTATAAAQAPTDAVIVSPPSHPESAFIFQRPYHLDLPETVIKALIEIPKLGYGFYIVGGLIRDSLFAVPANSDIDIVTDAPLTILTKYFPGLFPCHYVPNLWQLKPSEPSPDTMAREKLPTPSEYSLDIMVKKEFSFSMREDALTRDLTISAFYFGILDGKPTVFAPISDSISDLKSRYLRVIGNTERLATNPLIMFRVLRLAEKYSLWIPKELFSAIQHHCPTLLKLSPDHLGVELHKLFSRANSIQNILTLLEKTSILSTLFPCVAYNRNYYLFRPQLISHLEELKTQPTHYNTIYAIFLYFPAFMRFLETIQPIQQKRYTTAPETTWVECVSETLAKQTAHYPLGISATNTIKSILFAKQPVPLQPQLDSRTLPKQSL